MGKFVDVASAGDRKDYAQTLQQITRDGVCPFCPHNFKYHTRPILRRSRSWLVTENSTPYTGAKRHLLFILKRHVEHCAEMSTQEWSDLHLQVKWVTKKYNLPAGSFFMRFGDAKYTGSSVAHLHAHIILGSKRTSKSLPITPVLGFSAPEHKRSGKS
jgi:ATP adenylyltransferase